MAGNKVNTLVNNFNTAANLNLAGDQEKQLRELLTTAVERSAARREAGKQVVEQLQTAVQNNDSGALGGLLQQLREGFRQTGESRERFLDQFDQLLQPEQRARLLLYLVQRAQAAGTPVEQYVDTLLAQGGEDS